MDEFSPSDESADEAPFMPGRAPRDPFAWQRRIDAWRKEQRLGLTRFLDGGEEGVIEREGSALHEDAQPAVDVVLRREEREALAAALAGLEPELQELLVLMYVDGFTARMIAERTGSALRTVERQLSRGRNSLRKELEERGFREPGRGVAALAGGVFIKYGPPPASGVPSGLEPATSGGGASTGLLGTLAASKLGVLMLVVSGALVAFSGQIREDVPRLDGPERTGREEVPTVVDSVGPDAAEEPAAGRELLVDSADGTAGRGDLEASGGPQGAAAATGPPLLIVELVDDGQPVTGYRTGINWVDPSGQHRVRNSGDDFVEERPGRYVLRGDWVGKQLVLFLMQDPDLFHVRVNRTITDTLQTVTAEIDLEPRGFSVPLVEGQDYSLADWTTPSRSYYLVSSYGNGVWFLGRPRPDFEPVWVPADQSTGWSQPYDGELHFPSAPADKSAMVRRWGSVPLPDTWRKAPATEISFRD